MQGEFTLTIRGRGTYNDPSVHDNNIDKIAQRCVEKFKAAGCVITEARIKATELDVNYTPAVGTHATNTFPQTPQPEPNPIKQPPVSRSGTPLVKE